jgi:hypothetical protein
MFHVNYKKLLKEEKEMGAASVQYYEGTCLTCEHSPDRTVRAACPKADFFTVTTYISRYGDIKKTSHICKNWLLASEITSCFKKNGGTELQQPTQNKPKNGFKPKYMR